MRVRHTPHKKLFPTLRLIQLLIRDPGRATERLMSSFVNSGPWTCRPMGTAHETTHQSLPFFVMEGESPSNLRIAEVLK